MFVVIAGGSPLAVNLLRMMKGAGHKISIVLQDKERAMEVGSETGAIAVAGNPADPEVLDEMELERADVFIAACGSEEQSVVAALYAKDAGVKRVFVETVKRETAKVLRKEGIIPVDAEMHAAKMLELMISRPAVAVLASIGEGGADVIEIPCKGTKLVGKTMKDVAEKGFLPAGVCEGGTISVDAGRKMGKESVLLVVCKNGEEEKVRRSLR